MNGTLLESESRASSNDIYSEEIITPNGARGALLLLDITEIPEEGENHSLQVTIETKDPVSGNWLRYGLFPRLPYSQDLLEMEKRTFGHMVFAAAFFGEAEENGFTILPVPLPRKWRARVYQVGDDWAFSLGVTPL